MENIKQIKKKIEYENIYCKYEALDAFFLSFYLFIYFLVALARQALSLLEPLYQPLDIYFLNVLKPFRK
jgi:hypothetical protein